MGDAPYSSVQQLPLWKDNTPVPKPASILLLRERLQHYGSSTIAIDELIAIVLGTGSATPDVIQAVQHLVVSTNLQELLTIDFGELSGTYGLGDAKAVQLLAIFELARRLTLPIDGERYEIKCPADAANLVMAQMCLLDHEEMRILYLNTKNHVVANMKLYQGTLNSSVLRAAEIFKLAITRNCAGILICHNHPSGDPTPSQEDLDTTHQLVQVAELLNIELVDHIIIGNQRFISLKERLLW